MGVAVVCWVLVIAALSSADAACGEGDGPPSNKTVVDYLKKRSVQILDPTEFQTPLNFDYCNPFYKLNKAAVKKDKREKYANETSSQNEFKDFDIDDSQPDWVMDWQGYALPPQQIEEYVTYQVPVVEEVIRLVPEWFTSYEPITEAQVVPVIEEDVQMVPVVSSGTRPVLNTYNYFVPDSADCEFTDLPSQSPNYCYPHQCLVS